MNEQLFWLAINIYHEGRGEPLEGQIAIGHVCLNRALKKGKTLKFIILQPWQFSWHNGNKYPPIDDYDAFRACLNSAQKVADERFEGKNLWYADHYFNPSVVLPDWAAKMTLVKRIGNHDFYRE